MKALNTFVRRSIRRRILMRGLFGGDRFWLAIGSIVWTRRKVKELLGHGEPEAVYTEEVSSGDRFVLVHSSDTTSRRKRRR